MPDFFKFQEEVAQQDREAARENAQDLISILVTSGAKAAQRNTNVLHTVSEGLDNYRINLFKQAKVLTNKGGVDFTSELANNLGYELILKKRSGPQILQDLDDLAESKPGTLKNNKLYLSVEKRADGTPYLKYQLLGPGGTTIEGELEESDLEGRAIPSNKAKLSEFKGLQSIILKKTLEAGKLNISRAAVEKLSKKDSINNTQALLLHQLCTVQCFLDKVKFVEIHGAGNPETVLGIIKAYDEITNFSQYAVNVGKVDNYSFRLFQLANYQAYSGFTSPLWYKLLQDNKIDKSAKDLISKLNSAIAPSQIGENHSNKLTYDSFDSLRDNLQSDLHSWFESHSSYVNQLADNIALKVIPGFLGVRNDKAEENKLKVILTEVLYLIDKLGIEEDNICDFVSPYLSACYPNNAQELEYAKTRISQYITEASSLINNSDQAKDDAHLITTVRKDRNELKDLMRLVEKQRDEELFDDKLLSSDESNALTNMLASASPELKKRLTKYIAEHDSLGDELKGNLSKLVGELGVSGPALIILQSALENLAQNNNHKVKYYNLLLKRIKGQLIEYDDISAKGPDAKIIKRLDNETTKVLSFVTSATDPGQMLLENDNYGVFGGLINPTEFAVSSAKMPYNLSERLQQIRAIDKVLRDSERLCATESSFKIIMTTDEEGKPKIADAEDKYISNAYDRLNDAKTALKQKRDQLYANNVLLTLGTIQAATKDQVAEKDEGYRKQVEKASHVSALFKRGNVLTEKQRDSLRDVDLAKQQLITDKVDQLAKKIKQQCEQGESLELTKELAELKDLMIRLEVSSKSAGFDFKDLKIQLDLLTRFYSAPKSITDSELKELAKKVNFKDQKSAVRSYLEKGILAWNVYDSVTQFFSKLGSLISTVLTFPTAQLYRFIARKTKVNKSLSMDVKNLRAQVEQFKRSSPLDTETIKKLNQLIKDVDLLHGNIGRYSYSYDELRNKTLPELQQIFGKIQLDNKSVVNKAKDDTSIDSASVSSNDIPSSPTTSVASTADFSPGLKEHLDSVIKEMKENRAKYTQPGIVNRILKQSCYENYANSLLNGYDFEVIAQDTVYLSVLSTSDGRLAIEYTILTASGELKTDIITQSQLGISIDSSGELADFQQARLIEIIKQRSLVKSDVQPAVKSINDNTVYVRSSGLSSNSEAQQISYFLAGTTGKVARGIISQERLGDEVIPNNDSLAGFQKIRKSILKVATSRGHTVPEVCIDNKLNEIKQAVDAHVAKHGYVTDNYDAGRLYIAIEKKRRHLNSLARKVQAEYAYSAKHIDDINSIESELIAFEKDIQQKLTEPSAADKVTKLAKEKAEEVLKSALSSELLTTAFNTGKEAVASKLSQAPKTSIADLAVEFFSASHKYIVEQQGGNLATAGSAVSALTPGATAVTTEAKHAIDKEVIKYLIQFANQRTNDLVIKIEDRLEHRGDVEIDILDVAPLMKLQEKLVLEKDKDVARLEALSDQCEQGLGVYLAYRELYNIYSKYDELDKELLAQDSVYQGLANWAHKFVPTEAGLFASGAKALWSWYRRPANANESATENPQVAVTVETDASQVTQLPRLPGLGGLEDSAVADDALSSIVSSSGSDDSSDDSVSSAATRQEQATPVGPLQPATGNYVSKVWGWLRGGTTATPANDVATSADTSTNAASVIDDSYIRDMGIK